MAAEMFPEKEELDHRRRYHLRRDYRCHHYHLRRYHRRCHRHRRYLDLSGTATATNTRTNTAVGRPLEA